MTNEEIFNTNADFNKWLKELTETEKALILDMMEEARWDGFTDGLFELEIK